MSRYDTNGDGEISESEWLRAKEDFKAGKIAYMEMLAVLQAYMGSG